MSRLNRIEAGLKPERLFGKVADRPDIGTPQCTLSLVSQPRDSADITLRCWSFEGPTAMRQVLALLAFKIEVEEGLVAPRHDFLRGDEREILPAELFNET